MRQSVHREGVRSWVGAIGYIQVMSATGKGCLSFKRQGLHSETLENPRGI